MAGYSSALDKVYLKLVRYLNVSSIRPHLKQNQLLTDDEFERLDFACSKSSQQAAETLIQMVKRKGPSHEEDFIAALKESTKFDPHQGHFAIIEALEQEFDQDFVEKDFGISVKSKGLSTAETATVAAELSNGAGAGSHMKEAALRCKVVKANSEIKIAFTKLVLDVYRLLSRKKVVVEEIRLSLLYLGCFKDTSAASKSDQYSVIGSSSDLSHAETLQSLIECLHQYSSWYNYRLIKFVATEFGEEEGVVIIDNYIKILTTYCGKIIACQCPSFSLAEGLPPGYDQLVIKVDWDHLTCTAQDIAIFQAELSSLTNLEPEVFILKMVEEGCLLITWAVPQAVTTHIVMKAVRHQQQLAQWNVLSIIAAGKHIDIKQPKTEDDQSKAVPPLPPSRVSDSTSPNRSSFLSDYSDTSSVLTPLTLSGFGSAAMTAEEIEIVSTYSGRSRSSMYSTGSQLSSSGFVRTKFHSECDILSEKSLQIRLSNSLDVIPSKKMRAKMLLKSMLPKLFKANSKSEVAAKDCDDRHHKDVCSTPTPCAFPILDLSEEPTKTVDGKQIHYYHDSTRASDDYSALTEASTDLPLSDQYESEIDLFPGYDIASKPSQVLGDLRKHSVCTDNDATCGPSASGDVTPEPGLVNTTSEYSIQQFASVQRSQSMKCYSSVPCSNYSQKNGRLSSHKLTENSNPSLHPHTSCDRVDTPSSGYGESHSGCCSTQSSLYSIGSAYCNLPFDASPDSLLSLHTPYQSYSLKRNSITSVRSQSKVTKKSERSHSQRSHSFNGRYTVHHEL